MRPDLGTRRAHLTARFLRMLSVSLEQVALIRQALRRRQFEGLGGRVQALDTELDALERETEESCLEALALPRPALASGEVAADLHFALMIFRSLSDLERAGDYALHVGRDLEAVARTLSGTLLQDVLPLLDLLTTMLERLAYALTENDLHAARDVMRLDYEDVDALYEQMQRASLTRLLEVPGDIDPALKANRMARSLERLGDHLVNVAERVEGHLKAWPRSPREMPSA